MQEEEIQTIKIYLHLITESSFPRLFPEFKDGEIMGCFFFCDLMGKNTLFQEPCITQKGEHPESADEFEEKEASLYKEAARKAVRRLRSKSKYVSSTQCEDRDNCEAVAIRLINGCILIYSNPLESTNTNEAICVSIAEAIGLISENCAIAICNVSRNIEEYNRISGIIRRSNRPSI